MDRKSSKSITYEWVRDEWEMIGRIEAEELVDRIYDDFDSRTCSNCKFNYDIENGDLACANEYMIAEFNTYPQFPLVVEGDFGCVKFGCVK